jgi:signal transduction histidine kinase
VTGAPWVASARVRCLVDVAIVIGGFGIGLAGHLAARGDPSIEAAPARPLVIVFAAAAAALLALRRTRPLAMVGLLVVVVMSAGVVGDPSLFSAQIAVELVISSHAIGSWSRHRRRGFATVLTLGAVLALAAIPDNGVLGGSAFVGALVGLPYAVGVAARGRRRYLEAIEDRLAQAERERDERAGRAVAEERARLARELHDVVAHHVSMIGVQAGAARVAARADRASLDGALLAIESSSREAIVELRRVLEVLGPTDAGADRAPAPDLDRIHGLCESWREAGIDVGLVIADDDQEARAAVGADLALCCYRIVEEALTNVSRHSQANRANVSLVVGRESVHITVTDDGPAVDDQSVVPGRGLWGMRQRAALFAGEFDAGTTASGGFRVSAVLRVVP